MGYIRYPAYYEQFRCTASACTDNCCIGWEIDIDDDTLARYQHTDGAFSTRLHDSIALPSNEEETAHFILDQNERCPFLNKNNLCDIYTTLGEQNLCQICTDHPRFYDWFPNGKECGIGLCCESAAEQILSPDTDFTFREQSDGEAIPANFDETERAEIQIANLLFFMRDELFDILHTDFPSYDDKIDALYSAAADMQEHCYGMFFPDIQTEPFADASWSHAFWTASYLKPLLSFFSSLEINDAAWKQLLVRLSDRLPDILNHRKDFLTDYRDHLYEYDHLLHYFIYRHFMKARNDGAVLDRVVLALISTGMIQMLDILSWLEHGSLSHAQQINICKLYAKEIEYSETNTEEVSLYPLPC